MKQYIYCFYEKVARVAFLKSFPEIVYHYTVHYHSFYKEKSAIKVN